MPITETHDTSFVDTISQVLDKIIRQNDKMPNKTVTIFHAVRAPDIKINAYVERIAKYAGCNKDFFIMALIYIDRLIQRNPTYLLNSLNIHRLLMTSLVVACKFSNDFFYNNAYYAMVGGVPVSELNALELEFLYLLNFHLYIPQDLFDHYNAQLFKYSSSGPKQSSTPASVSSCGMQSIRNNLEEGLSATTVMED